MPNRDGHVHKAGAPFQQFEHLQAETGEKVANSALGATDLATPARRKSADPGESRKVLLALAGHWITSSKSWSVAGEPTVTPGTVDARLILDGRFLEQNFSSTMMAKPITGIGILGYDDEKKKFVATWLDSRSNGIRRGEGTLDAAGKVLAMKWSATGKGAGGPTATTAIQRFESDSRRVSEFYEKGADGKDRQFLEIVYTR